MDGFYLSLGIEVNVDITRDKQQSKRGVGGFRPFEK